MAVAQLQLQPVPGAYRGGMDGSQALLPHEWEGGKTQPAVSSPTNVVDGLSVSAGARQERGGHALQGARSVLGEAVCRTGRGTAKRSAGMQAGKEADKEQEADKEEANREQARYRAARLAYVSEMDIDLALPTVMLRHVARLAEHHSASILRDSRNSRESEYGAASSAPVDDLQRVSPESRLVRTLLARQTSVANVDALLAILAQGSQAPLIQVMMANTASLADPPTWREPRNSWPSFETTSQKILDPVGLPRPGWTRTNSSWLGRVWATLRVRR